MEIAGYGVRVMLEQGTTVVRFRDVGGGVNAGDGFLSSLTDGQGGVGNQTVLANGGGPAQLGETAPGASPLGGLHLEPYPAAAAWSGWRLMNGTASCRWPAGTSLTAAAPGGAWKESVLNVNQDSAVIHIQGPLTPAMIPLPGDLMPPDHKVVGMDYDSAIDQMWIDVGYVHDDVLWRQRHQFVPLGESSIFVVRAQAPDGSEARAWEALVDISSSFDHAPGQGDTPRSRSPLRRFTRQRGPEPEPVVKALVESWRGIIQGAR